MQWWDGEWCDAGIDGLVSPVAVALMADLELVGINYNFALIAILKSS
jgi:hypothetical protein